jgi:hypothetical protein
VLTLLYSLREAIKHLDNYWIPRLQKHTIRILFMAPVYAISSWIGMRFMQEAVYLGTLRELYEAFTVYSCARAN